MALDPRIALQAQTVDLGGAGDRVLQGLSLRQANLDSQQRRKLIEIQTKKAETELSEFEKNTKTREAESFTELELLEGKSLANAAGRLKSLIDANDINSARSFLEQRREMFRESGIEFSYPDELLDSLEKGPQEFQNAVNKSVEFGTRMGFLKPDKQLSGSDDPAAVREFKFLEQKFPEMKLGYNDYLNIKRQGYQISEIGGVPTLVARNPGVASQPVSTLEREASGKAAIAGAVETAKDTASMQVDKQKAFPKARNTLSSLEQQWNLVDDSIDRALKQIAPYSAGAGAWTKVIPSSPAKDLEQTLETIKANVGFDKLQDMRANSPTGGALGQVSDFENKLLQSVKGSLVQNQSPSQLRANLERVRDDLRQLRKERASSFQSDFAEFLNEGVPAAPAAPKRVRVDAQGNVIGN